MKPNEETIKRIIGEESTYSTRALYNAFREVAIKAYEEGYAEGFERFRDSED